MIAKARATPKPAKTKRGQPLDVELTVRFNFGETPEDAVTVMDRQHLPMVDSVFKSRDRILKGFVSLLVKTGLAQPRVAAELLPFARLLKKS